MGFWGIEVKPGKPYRYHSNDEEGTVYLTQATLGRGKSMDKCVLQCSSRDKSPVYLCSLLPDQTECCPLSLEFEDADDVVFSVVGSRSIHIAGKFVADEDEEHSDEECYDSDSFGEDIADTDTEDSNDYGSEDEYGGDFIDDDDTDLVPNSGVTIEEIVDDDKPTAGNGKSERPKKKKKKDQLSDSEEKNLQRQIVVKSGSGVPVLESEDEDGFPISSSHKNDVTEQKPVAGTEQTEKGTTEKTKKKKAKDIVEGATGIKRKVEDVDQDLQPEREKKKKKKKHQKEQDEEENTKDQPEEVKHQNLSQVSSAGSDLDQKAMDGNETRSEEKKKKKNKKKKKKTETAGDLTSTEQNVSDTGDKGITTIQVEEHNEPKPSQARTFGNGLVIEELTMGKPDGKRASPGRVVGVHYTGKLKNGEIFDSSIGGKPFTFRLGVGGVIKGWDIGVNGMRIGDKRRLTIPPAMGYGAKGAGEKIPPDSWLVFDIELVEVR